MESQFIAWLRTRLPAHPSLRMGAGDDAAVLRLAGDQCVVTIDLLSDGVDFDLREHSAQRVGHKALAVNLSDLAAMAARPLAAVIALSLPRLGGYHLGCQLYEGLLPLAERYQLAIAGGDTNSWDGPLVISITAIGEPGSRGPLKRSGARPGDWLLATGEFGGSILKHHLDFEPRVNEALALCENYDVHAGIDVSDGLTVDLGHICDESVCGAVVDLNAVPIAAAARELARQQADGCTALDHALGDGEDFELLLAVPPDAARQIMADQPLDVPISRLGEFVTEPGLWHGSSSGERAPLARRGWEHRFE